MGGSLNTVVAVLLIAFVLLNAVVVHEFIYISAASSDFELIGYGWNSQVSPERVYPGSSKVSYYVTLMYVGGSEVRKIYAELYLPQGIVTFSEGFKVAYSESDLTLGKYDAITLEFPNLNISDKLRSGSYMARLDVLYQIVGGMSYTTTIYVPMVISEVPREPLELVDYYWSTKSGLRRSLTPEFSKADLVFYLRVKEDLVIRNVYAIISLPEGLSCGGLRNATLAVESVRYVKGDLIELRFNNIDIGRDLLEGSLNITLYVNSQLDLYGLTTNVTQLFNVTSSIDYSVLRVLEVVDAYWGREGAVPLYPNTSKATLSVVVMNVGSESIYGLVGRLFLPDGFKHLYGGNVVNTSISSRLGPGVTAVLTFDNINVGSNVRPGNYQFKLLVEYFIDFGGSSIRVLQEYNISSQVLDVGEFLSIIAVRWVNNYGVGFPSSRGELEVILSNWDEYAVELVEPTVKLPTGFKLLSIGGDCFNGIPPYSTCSLRLTLDVGSDVVPGDYLLNITLRYLIRVGSSDVVLYRNLTRGFKVWDPGLFGAKLEPANVVWGDVANPREALPGSKLLPLTLDLVNVGRDVATGVIANIELPEGLVVAFPDGNASCDRVERGGSCTIRYYVNIDSSVVPGVYTARLTVRYVTYFDSANLSKVEVFNIRLPVSEYHRGLRLYVVEANWSNNWPAYPGDNAVFSVRVANLGPYTIYSVISRLELPEGFTCGGERSCESYFSGPLQQYQQFNTSFKVLISRDVRPGTYLGKLTFDYVVQTGGYGIRLSDTYTTKIYVSDISSSVRLVGIYWVNTTPSKGDVGLMRVVLRCDEIPSLSGLVLRFELPKGMVAVPNNSSNISIPYYQQLQLAGIQYLGGLPAQLAAPARITQGDIIYVDLPVRILEVPEEDAVLGVTAEFLDHWNAVQEVHIETSPYILSKSRVLTVEPVGNVVVAGKAVSEVGFKFTNLGDSPIYNLVIFALSPYSGISISDPVKYVDSIGGGDTVTLTFRATANPEVIEGPYPILFTAVLQDFSGRVYTLNLTSTLVVKGLEAIRLLSPQITPEVVANGSMITFSATIVNEGKTPLRHTVVSLDSEAIYDRSTYYVGNIDPDSQIPISLKAVVRDDVPPGTYSVKVLITYYDVFHELRTYEEVRYINVVANVTPTQTPQPLELPSINVMLVVGVAAFIICVTVFYLWWFKKRVGRSAQHS
ncbi:MAG: hypothetical protein QXO85_02260 [Sulfolobales archaeon]